VTSFLFDHALLPDGWAQNVRVDVAGGTITQVARSAPRDGAKHVRGIALPGLANVHCHSFQKAMAGLAERRGPDHDNFWTWREVMYRFLAALTPDDVEAIAAYAYMEMLEAGFTAVGEFHYLHHDVDGRPFADVGEMASRIAAAAAQTRIGLTLLPSLYAYGGFGGAEPAPEQRRFLNDPDRFLKIVARTREMVGALPDANVGIAPHSLRAVTPETLHAVIAATKDGPVHIHAAEQTKEVDECLIALGRRPVAWLLEQVEVGPRWCIVHATHTTAEETHRLAASGAVAGLCPLTEANLGDGIFDGKRFVEAVGRFGIGTDSNIEIDAAAELRQLEYSQRLYHRARNVLVQREGSSVGRMLYDGALAGGAQALGRPIGGIEPGRRADVVVLDGDHPDLSVGTNDTWLDVYVFAAGRRLIDTVLVGGETIVEHAQHRNRAAISARYRKAVARLTGQYTPGSPPESRSPVHGARRRQFHVSSASGGAECQHDAFRKWKVSASGLLHESPTSSSSYGRRVSRPRRHCP
jgi:formimidoylglutamate deiminase